MAQECGEGQRRVVNFKITNTLKLWGGIPTLITSHIYRMGLPASRGNSLKMVKYKSSTKLLKCKSIVALAL